jgi:predicted nicotinamide N-methyase
LSTTRLQLLDRIHRRYQTVTQPIRAGAVTLEFTRIADPDRVLDEVCAEEDLRERLGRPRRKEVPHLPYWAELWESASGVASALSKFKLDAGVRVLDLGCGMGLAGTAAAAMGASVVMADLESPALLLARLNSLPYASRIRTRRLNWQSDRLAEKFDLIVGADIVYEKVQWESLDAFWKSHLADGGCVLLGEPGRQTGDMFVQWIASRGWSLTETAEKVPTREKAIRIFKLELTQPSAERGGIP